MKAVQAFRFYHADGLQCEQGLHFGQKSKSLASASNVQDHDPNEVSPQEGFLTERIWLMALGCKRVGFCTMPPSQYCNLFLGVYTNQSDLKNIFQN